MSVTPAEQQTGAERLNDALVQFAACIGAAVPDICSYGLTIGAEYVPFDPDDDEDEDEDDNCDDVMCSQVWVRVMGVTPFGQTDSFGGDSCSVSLRLELEVGVLRCFPARDEGEAPTASEVLVAATVAMEDMIAIQCAALGCEVWDSITLGTWVPNGPAGAQYGGVWTFNVEVA